MTQLIYKNSNCNSFYLLIEQIIRTVKITKRDLLFKCIDKLWKKFQNTLSFENNFFKKQYFNILSGFLTGINKINPENSQEIKKFNEIYDSLLIYIKNPKEFLFCNEILTISADYIKALRGINEKNFLILKSIKLIIEHERTLNLNSFYFVSIFLFNIHNIISDTSLEQADILKEIIIIIENGFFNSENSSETSKKNCLLLTLQLFNLNSNLDEKDYDFLISASLGSYEVPQENQKYNSWMIINQLSISIISLGLIFRPDLIFKSLVQVKEKNEAVLFGLFIIFILSTLIIVFPKYNPLLGKCIILGICGILNDKTWLEYLDSNKEKKISLLTILLNFVVKQHCFHPHH